MEHRGTYFLNSQQGAYGFQTKREFMWQLLEYIRYRHYEWWHNYRESYEFMTYPGLFGYSESHIDRACRELAEKGLLKLAVGGENINLWTPVMPFKYYI